MVGFPKSGQYSNLDIASDIKTLFMTLLAVCSSKIADVNIIRRFSKNNASKVLFFALLNGENLPVSQISTPNSIILIEKLTCLSRADNPNKRALTKFCNPIQK